MGRTGLTMTESPAAQPKRWLADRQAQVDRRQGGDGGLHFVPPAASPRTEPSPYHALLSPHHEEAGVELGRELADGLRGAGATGDQGDVPSVQVVVELRAIDRLTGEEAPYPLGSP